VYNALVVTPERAFLEEAQAITQIGSAANNVSTSYNNINDTYTITMDVLGLAVSTGIFSTLQGLGVVSVQIGTETTLVSSLHIHTFIAALEVAFDNVVQEGDDYLVTMNFIGNISQSGYASFSANFVVNFQMTATVYNTFVSELAD
jgi:hypothetical protein